MCEVNIIDTFSNPINIPLRKSTEGPEIDIVRCYIDTYCALAEKRSWKHNVMIFVEPRLDTGYPDLLIAHYDVSRIKEWNNSRNLLSARDLKILALLMNKKKIDIPSISYISGFNENNVQDSLELLVDCDFVIQLGNYWKAANKTKFFSLERLVSIEAKIGNALGVLEQAYRNISFTSHSYSLLDNEKITQRLKNKYESFGVGAIVGKSFHVAVCPKKRRIPICYTSLLINEWITKYVTMGVALC